MTANNIDTLIDNIKNNQSTDYKKMNIEYPYSVTKIVECFHEPFDKEGQAERCSQKYKNDPSSKYYNMEPWDILEMWEKSGELGRSNGRMLDDYIGFILMNSKSEADNLYTSKNGEPICNKFNTFNHLYNNEFVANNYKFLARELTLCDPVYKWKGRFDAMFYKDNNVYLIDWKNNDKITTENTYKNLKGPLYKYQDTDLNRYTIQLYLYKYVLEKYYGFDNIKPILCRIGEHDYQFYVPHIPYSEQLINDILKHAINTLNKQ